MTAQRPPEGAADKLELESLRGRSVGQSTIVIERGPVEAFAAAVFDENPLYRDPAAASAAGLPGIPVPATFPLAFETWGRRDELQPEGAERFALNEFLDPLVARGALVLHGEQGFDYHAPVFVGQVLDGRSTIVDVYSRESKGRRMDFVVLETAWRDRTTAEPVVTTRMTVIVRF